MLGGWLGKAQGPIGLDLGSQTVRMLQMAPRSGRGGSGGHAAVAACARAWPADLPAQGPERVAAMAEFFRDMLEDGGFVGRDAISCLPAGAVQYRNIRLPKMPADELRAAVEWEANGRLNLAQGGKVAIQYYDAGDVQQGEEVRHEIILLATTPGAVDEHVSVLHACGLRPLAIDALPSALARAVAGADEVNPDAPARFVLDVGHASTKALFVRQGRVLFFKIIDIGGLKFDQAVAARLDLSLGDAGELRRQLRGDPGTPGAAPGAKGPLFGSGRRENVERTVSEALRSAAGDLAREVGLCLRYYSVTFRGRRPEQAILVGGGATEPQLVKALADDAGVTVAPFTPSGDLTGAGVKALGDSPTPGPWAAALGLALRPAEAAARRQVA